MIDDATRIRLERVRMRAQRRYMPRGIERRIRPRSRPAIDWGLFLRGVVTGLVVAAGVLVMLTGW